MRRKICYIMVGVSGSGKSTISEKIAKIHDDVAVGVFSLDNCRLSYYHDVKQFPRSQITVADYSAAFNLANEEKKDFDDLVNKIWASTLDRSDVLIVDNTNLTRKSRIRWVSAARQKGFTVIAIQVMVPLAVPCDRQSTRPDKSVDVDIVRDMYMRVQEVKVPEEADFIINADGTTGEMFFQKDFLPKNIDGKSLIEVFQQEFYNV